MAVMHISSPDNLSFVLRGAIGNALNDAHLADRITKIVLNAIENYEDERFLAILKESENDAFVDMEKIRDALK